MVKNIIRLQTGSEANDELHSCRESIWLAGSEQEDVTDDGTEEEEENEGCPEGDGEE